MHGHHHDPISTSQCLESCSDHCYELLGFGPRFVAVLPISRPAWLEDVLGKLMFSGE